MSDGLEGWLQTQYLILEPIARDQLVTVEEELSKLKSSHQQTLTELEELKSREADVSGSNASLQSKNDALTDELNNLTELAANVIAIDEQNKQFQLPIHLVKMNPIAKTQTKQLLDNPNV